MKTQPTVAEKIDPTILVCYRADCNACVEHRMHQPEEWATYHPVTKGVNKH